MISIIVTLGSSNIRIVEQLNYELLGHENDLMLYSNQNSLVIEDDSPANNSLFEDLKLGDSDDEYEIIMDEELDLLSEVDIKSGESNDNGHSLAGINALQRSGAEMIAQSGYSSEIAERAERVAVEDNQIVISSFNTQAEIALYSDALANATQAQLDTPQFHNDLADAVLAVLDPASALSGEPTIAQLSLIGIISVTSDNLASIQNALIQAHDANNVIETVAQLQAMATGGDNTQTIGAITDTDILGNGALNLISENAAIGTAVGITVQATDPGDVISYVLTNNVDNLFAIDSATGVVTLANDLDYTSATSHDITVEAISTDGSSTSETFTIRVGENNDGAGGGDNIGIIVDIDATTGAVSEHAIIGTNIGITVQAIDADATDSVTYALSDDADGLFTIDSTTGIVTVAAQLDYETATSHDITVVASSSDGTSSNKTFTVEIGDNNTGIGGNSGLGDQTGVISGIADIDNSAGDASTNLVSELAVAGTAVGITASAIDVGDAITYSLSVNPEGLFDINSVTGVVTLIGSLDFDTAQSHEIVVLASSFDGSSASETFVVNVGENNNGAGGGSDIGSVADEDDTIGVVSENAIFGTPVGITAQSIDADLSDIVAYALSDDGNVLFSIDSVSGVVTVAASLDYETATSHTITVEATSSDGSSSNESFVIGVGDNDIGIGGGTSGGDNTASIGVVTDIDTAGHSATNLVAQNAAIGTPVGITASAVDTDANDTIIYSLVDDADGLFVIDSDSGVVALASELEFDINTDNTHNITVLATSLDGSSTSESFVVTVGENNLGAGGGSDLGAVNDVDLISGAISENAAIGTEIGITAQAIDSDSQNTVAYTLGDDANGLFVIDSLTGVVTLAQHLDFESATSHHITVVASSSDGTTSTETFVIDVADNGAGIGGDGTQGDSTQTISDVVDIDVDALMNLVSENAPVGTPVGITASATDVGDDISYSLSSDPSGLFAIDSSSGVVTLAGELDFTTVISHYIIVLATSSDGSSSSEFFTIGVGKNNIGLGGGNDI
ncbi:MAG: cadherin repeat domain-containing protein, partial [Psychrobium sp.]|nr:cadherin repeat domain-containing protein [Psychrobium sp.]